MSQFVNPMQMVQSPPVSFQRDNQICGILRNWKVTFGNEPKDNVEEFLVRLTSCQRYLKVPDIDLLNLMPVILTGSAQYWARTRSSHWNSLADFTRDFRLQYGVIDFQMQLEDEVRARTQGQEEPISDYLVAIKLLLDKIVPPWTEERQLDRAHRNLNPTYYRCIRRSQFSTFYELQHIGKLEEARIRHEKSYRPPPPADSSLFPDIAYRSPIAKGRTAAITTEHLDSVAALDTLGDEPRNNSKYSTGNGLKPTRRDGSCREIKNSDNRSRNPTGRPPDSSSPPIVKSSRNRTDNRIVQSSSHGTADRIVKSSNSKPCWLCNKMGHWADRCPAKQGILCYRCKLPGYVSKTCPNCNKHSEN